MMASNVDDRPLLKTRTPDRNATPSTMARPLITSRTLRASRLRRVSLSTSRSSGLGGAGGGQVLQARHVLQDLLAPRVPDLVDHEAVREEHDTVAVRRGE